MFQETITIVATIDYSGCSGMQLQDRDVSHRWHYKNYFVSFK
jgi:hypothetical protein